MKKIYVVALGALLAASCQKEFGSGVDGAEVGAISADFDWKTIRDVQVTVEAPKVEGQIPEYAIVRVYASPCLVDANLLAKGVARAGTPFRTSFSMPAGAARLYVETRLPDGTAAVEAVDAAATVSVPGVAMRRVAQTKFGAAARSGSLPSDMPEFPLLAPKQEADFDARAVIREIGTGSYKLGASWAYYPAAEYFIPADATITEAIDLNGGFQPFEAPVLYVAGKLRLGNLHIGRAQLVVLPGGEVEIGGLTASGSKSTDKPSLYLFEGGKLRAEKINFSGITVVNCGQIDIPEDDFDLNNSAVLYNAQSGNIQADEIKCSNSVAVHSDGTIVANDLKLNSTAAFHNYQNGRLQIDDECQFERNTVIFQSGAARMEEMEARGTMYVNCYTLVGSLEGQGADIRLGAGVALEVLETELNHSTVSMAGGSVFQTETYNSDEKGGNNAFEYASVGTDAPAAVVSITDEAHVRKGHATYFRGNIEVVYDNERDKEHRIGKEYFVDGAVMRPKQTVVIDPGYCNGDRETVAPEPEPEPEEFVFVPGQRYTYCYEDNWPWFGDYDMNDAVVVCNIDRMVSQDGSKVASIEIDWELKAAGTTYEIAFALQMDRIRTEEIASVESTHRSLGSGIFEDRRPEAGSAWAIVPFFNKTGDLLAASNTWKGQSAPTTRHRTKVVFTQPIDAERVLESQMNFFIAAKHRANEIHMPGFAPTAAGAIGTGSFLATDPYKFFDVTGDKAGYNHMMWALMIPGEFRYPVEGKNIVTVYDHFLAWAASNGTTHTEWYLEEAQESLLY